MIDESSKLSLLFRRISLGIILMAFPTVTVALFYMAWNGEQIHLHGRRIEAQVTGIYPSCGKHGCDDIVEYQFQPYGMSEYFRSYGTIGEANLANPNIIYVHARHSVPIAYDTTYPTRSSINFNDRAMHPMSIGLRIIEILLITSSACFSVMFGIIILRKNPLSSNGDSANISVA
jgi:hypothetical protein